MNSWTLTLSLGLYNKVRLAGGMLATSVLFAAAATGLARAEVIYPASLGSAPPPQRVALVVGNAAYRISPLANPTQDASDFAAALKDLGFAVTEALNVASRSEMTQLVENWSKTIRPDGVALFFYSGHGAQEAGNNYLIPTMARVLTGGDLVSQALPLEDVMGAMSSPDNHLNILIIDACRSPMSRAIAKGLAPVVGAQGTFIAYATAPGCVASDGYGRNGLFTKHLLAHVKTPEVGIEEMFRRVRCGVLADDENKARQMPWDASSLTAGFSFSPATAIAQAGGNRTAERPVITFTKVPVFVKEADPNQWVDIGGTVTGADPERHRIFLYAGTDRFHVQPVVGEEATAIEPDGSWHRRIHPGERYAALLAPRDFAPAPSVSELPSASAGVLATQRVPEGKN